MLSIQTPKHTNYTNLIGIQICKCTEDAERYDTISFASIRNDLRLLYLAVFYSDDPDRTMLRVLEILEQLFFAEEIRESRDRVAVTDD